MTKPENALYRCEQIRACEQQAMSLYQLDENELMSRAGTEAFFILKTLSSDRTYSRFLWCGE